MVYVFFLSVIQNIAFLVMSIVSSVFAYQLMVVAFIFAGAEPRRWWGLLCTPAPNQEFYDGRCPPLVRQSLSLRNYFTYLLPLNVLYFSLYAPDTQCKMQNVVKYIFLSFFLFNSRRHELQLE